MQSPTIREPALIYVLTTWMRGIEIVGFVSTHPQKWPVDDIRGRFSWGSNGNPINLELKLGPPVRWHFVRCLLPSRFYSSGHSSLASALPRTCLGWGDEQSQLVISFPSYLVEGVSYGLPDFWLEREFTCSTIGRDSLDHRRGRGRGRGPWNHGSTPQDWNEGKEWKDKWMGNPPMCWE